ncbi:hypothetical protein FRC19_002414 [Serendipita sp. 401]|nr:hypothetical protein FRC19_002414 [Serendipita sp. 401]KAG9041310.1 hypothetical protein FS842_002605 [Serendipita sp. 407]
MAYYVQPPAPPNTPAEQQFLFREYYNSVPEGDWNYQLIADKFHDQFKHRISNYFQGLLRLASNQTWAPPHYPSPSTVAYPGSFPLPDLYQQSIPEEDPYSLSTSQILLNSSLDLRLPHTCTFNCSHPELVSQPAELRPAMSDNSIRDRSVVPSSFTHETSLQPSIPPLGSARAMSVQPQSHAHHSTMNAKEGVIVSATKAQASNKKNRFIPLAKNSTKLWISHASLSTNIEKVLQMESATDDMKQLHQDLNTRYHSGTKYHDLTIKDRDVWDKITEIYLEAEKSFFLFEAKSGIPKFLFHMLTFTSRDHLLRIEGEYSELARDTYEATGVIPFTLLFGPGRGFQPPTASHVGLKPRHGGSFYQYIEWHHAAHVDLFRAMVMGYANSLWTNPNAPEGNNNPGVPTGDVPNNNGGNEDDDSVDNDKAERLILP